MFRFLIKSLIIFTDFFLNTLEESSHNPFFDFCPEEGHSTLKCKKCFTFSAKKLNIFIILFLKKAPSTYFPSVTKSLFFFHFRLWVWWISLTLKTFDRRWCLSIINCITKEDFLLWASLARSGTRIKNFLSHIVYILT